jgi:hypothetical protein
MKSFVGYISTILAMFVLFTGCASTENNVYRLTKNYKPDDQQLYNTIVHLDSAFFGAYNTCDSNLDKYGSFFSDNIEFYHDQGGLMTSRQDIIDATKRNICGKVTRELVKGSIEVYPIKGFGAVEIGLHKFHNNQQPPGSPSKVGRFTIVWKYENNEWKIIRVISLH